MKKSFKFLFVFSAVAIILCCSVFVSAAESSDIVKFSPSEFIDKFDPYMSYYDNDGELYEYKWSKTVVSSKDAYMSDYLNANPGLNSDMNPCYFYGMSSFITGLEVHPGEYVSTKIKFYARVSNGAKIKYCSLSAVDSGSEELNYTSFVDGEYFDYYYYEYNTIHQNTTDNVWKSFEMDFTFGFSGKYQYADYGLGFNDDIVMSVSSEKPKYSQPSDSAITQQDDLTSELENQNSAGNEEASNIFNSFDGVLGSDSNLYRGLLACTTIINEWLGVEWVSPIISFSLVLGMFSFLLGSSIYFSNFASRKEAYNRRVAALEKRNSKSKGS